MTESPFPFGSPAEPELALPEQSEESTRRPLLLAGGVVAALAVAAGGFLLLTGGGDEDLTLALPPPRAAQPAAPPVVEELPTIPVAFSEDLGRDPFRALYVEPAPVAEQPEQPAAPAAPAAPATPVDLPVGFPAPLPGEGPGPAPAPQEPSAQEHELVLDGVSHESGDLEATFRINGEEVLVTVGEVFGPTKEIKLVSLQQGPAADQWTAVLQVGDAEPFDAVTGETYSVR